MNKNTIYSAQKGTTPDTIFCPNCGTEHVIINTGEAVDIDETIWKDRIRRAIDVEIRSLKRSPDYKDFSEEKTIEMATNLATFAVSVNMYREWVVREAVAMPAIEIDAATKQYDQNVRVYFVQSINGGLIKIGRSQNPIERVKSFNHPDGLVILATVGGGHKKERELHKKFAHLRNHREWFNPEPELLEYIESVKKEASDNHPVSKRARTPRAPRP